MNTINTDRQDMVNELEKYAELDNTENGELCVSLCDVYDNISIVGSDFKFALLREIEWHLDNYKTHCTIVSRDVSVVNRVTGLVWDDE